MISDENQKCALISQGFEYYFVLNLDDLSVKFRNFGQETTFYIELNEV